MKFEILKTRFRVIFDDGTKWSMPYDEGGNLSRLKPMTFAEFAEHCNYELYGDHDPTAIVASGNRRQVYEDRGLIVDIYSRAIYGGNKTTTLKGMKLTPLGAELLDTMPKCPPEEEWPANIAKAERERNNVSRGTLSAAQAQRLDHMLTVPVSKAVPVGGHHAEESRWHCEYRNTGTNAALHRKGLIEKGLRGIDIVDGILSETGAEVETVYRLTMVGALIAKPRGSGGM